MTIYTSWHLKPVHRNTDSRTCGATTSVSGQSTVFANNLLVSVNADPNSHSAGALVAGSNHVYAENTLVVNNSPDGSAADALCPSAGGAHCSPSTSAGSSNVYVGDLFSETLALPATTDITVSYSDNVQAALSDTAEEIADAPELSKAEQVDDGSETPSAGGGTKTAPAGGRHSVANGGSGFVPTLCGDMPTANPWDVAMSAGPVPKGSAGDPWKEIAGAGANQSIANLWAEIGYGTHFADHTAWCAVFTGAILKRAGCEYIKTASSRAYSSYGIEVLSTSDIENNWNTKRGLIKQGDIAVFYRKGKSSVYGHVGFCNGTTTKTRIEILGGNQSDSLNVRSFAKGPSARKSGNWGLLTIRRAQSCDGISEVPEAGGPPLASTGSGGPVG